MQILCPVCESRSSCYSAWLNHLLSSEHQTKLNTSLDHWVGKEKDRSFLVTPVPGSEPPRFEEVVQTFAAMGEGLISDAFYPENKRFVLLEIDNVQSCRNLARSQHNVNSVGVTCRLRSDITTEEWRLLCRKGRVGKDRLSLLENELTDLLTRSEMNPEDVRLRQTCVNNMTIFFNGIFPNAIAHPYGSSVTGMGNKDSKLKIYFDALGLTNERKVPIDGNWTPISIIDTMVEKLLKTEKSQPGLCKDLVTSLHKPCPGLEFFVPPSFPVKITVLNMLPVQSSKFIHFMTLLDGRVKPFCTVIHEWAKSHDLLGKNKIRRYAWTLMAFVLLAKNRILPTVATIQSMSSSPMLIEGCWDVSFCDDLDKVTNLMSILNYGGAFEVDESTGNPKCEVIIALLRQFCETYAAVNYNQLVLSPLLGDFQPKAMFEWHNVDSLPDAFAKYRNWGIRCNYKYGLNMDTPLCVQDPFRLISNVTENTPHLTVERFVQACGRTLMQMNQGPVRLADLIVSPLDPMEMTCSRESNRLSGNLHRPPLLPEPIRFNVPSSSTSASQSQSNWQTPTRHLRFSPYEVRQNPNASDSKRSAPEGVRKTSDLTNRTNRESRPREVIVRDDPERFKKSKAVDQQIQNWERERQQRQRDEISKPKMVQQNKNKGVPSIETSKVNLNSKPVSPIKPSSSKVKRVIHKLIPEIRYELGVDEEFCAAFKKRVFGLGTVEEIGRSASVLYATFLYDCFEIVWLKCFGLEVTSIDSTDLIHPDPSKRGNYEIVCTVSKYRNAITSHFSKVGQGKPRVRRLRPERRDMNKETSSTSRQTDEIQNSNNGDGDGDTEADSDVVTVEDDNQDDDVVMLEEKKETVEHDCNQLAVEVIDLEGDSQHVKEFANDFKNRCKMNEVYREKFSKIPEKFCFAKAYRCTGTTFYHQRLVTRKGFKKDQKAWKTQDPLNIEAEVHKVTMHYMYSNIQEAGVLTEMSFDVAVNVNTVPSPPEILMVLRSTTDSSAIDVHLLHESHQCMSSAMGVLRSLIPQYAKFRLMDWLKDGIQTEVERETVQA